jgi:predicted nucleic acid-binding protein
MLLDTTVLVDALRGREEAVEFIEDLEDRPAVSVVTVGELYVGIGRDEEAQLKRFLSVFRALPIDGAIARQAGYWRRDFAPSHGVSLADALIAATAGAHQLEFVTHNTKHFPMLEAVTVPY